MRDPDQRSLSSLCSVATMALAMSAVRTWVGTGAAARAAAFASARPLLGDDASSAEQPVNETPHNRLTTSQRRLGRTVRKADRWHEDGIPDAGAIKDRKLLAIMIPWVANSYSSRKRENLP